MKAIAYYFRLLLAALPIAALLLVHGYVSSVVVLYPIWTVFTSGMGAIGSCFDPLLMTIYLGCAACAGITGYGMAFGEMRRYVALLARDEPPGSALRRIFCSLLLRRFLVMLPWVLGFLVVPRFRFQECLWFLVVGGAVFAIFPVRDRVPLRGDAERLAMRDLQHKADRRAIEASATAKHKGQSAPTAVRGVAVSDTHTKREEEIILR